MDELIEILKQSEVVKEGLNIAKIFAVGIPCVYALELLFRFTNREILRDIRDENSPLVRSLNIPSERYKIFRSLALIRGNSRYEKDWACIDEFLEKYGNPSSENPVLC